MRGFWMVEWFKREFGATEVARAGAMDIPPEGLFEELLAASQPGSMGLVLQPYWMPGVRYPGPEAKGALLGFGDIHGRAHVYRAILEGLAYALREGAERTVKRSRVPIRELRVSGGGSQSRAAVQLFADVFGLPASRPHTHEAAGLGAAIDVLLGLGIHADPVEAVAAMVRITDTFEPDAAAHRTYDDLFNSVYLRMYDRLKPLYREIQRITGYPPA
jgi:sugar (pentulose or hexulose) kinase